MGGEMKERFMTEVLGKMQHLNDIDKEYLRNVLAITMNNYDICLAKNELVEWNNDKNYELLKMFLISKRVEGCSDKTINYYKGVLTQFLDKSNIPVEQMQTNNIRFYLANRDVVDHVSKTTQNNERRVLSSFFTWLFQEEYILKNPTLKVKAIKTEKRKKKAFSEVEVEKLRNACRTKRERCIIEILLSTGCRVDGLVGMKRSDINGNSITVFEKGKKERIVFFNAKAKLFLEEYLSERTDDNDVLIVSSRGANALSESAIELIVKNIGDRAGVSDCHPHKFRRSCATFARRRGMSIEDIQKMLGHEHIDTTMIYIADDDETMELNHRRYVI